MSNDRTPWTMVLGQVVVFVIAASLLIIHVFAVSVFGRPATIDGPAFALLGFMSLAIVLPQLSSLKLSKEGLEVRLQEQAQKARALSEQAVGAAPVATTDSPALREASTAPLSSLELSRRALAEAVRELAAKRAVQTTATSIAGIAADLRKAEVISSDAEKAIRELADTIGKAKANGLANPSLALDVDYGTQILAGYLKALEDPAR